jgi:15-cis-phytoene desaturase
MNVIIIGAGISGLTSAHELIKYGYNVTVIERNSIVGGLARTYQNKINKICPIEYSWRAYGKWYQNVFHTMNEIPFNNNETVFNQLVELQGGEKTCDKKTPNYAKTLTYMSLNDSLKLLPYLIIYLISCDKRNIQMFSSINIRLFLKKLNISKSAEDAIGKIVGPYLGFDYHHASLYDLLYTFEMIANNSDPKYNFSITKYPTNFAWFDPWVKILKQKGVKFYLDTEVKNININNNKINYLTIYNKKTGHYKKINAHYYINCTGPEILYKLLKPYKTYYNSFYNMIHNVCKFGYQIQLSIYFYIDKNIFLEKKNTLSYLPNTPWLLMVLPTGHIWGDDFLKNHCNHNIKEVLSVGICEPYVNGNLIKKPWSKCNIDEIKIETWNQLINDKDFVDNICIENNDSIDNVNIIDFKMWDSYKFIDGKMTTYEPKWANNVETAKYRPIPISPIDNLIIAGSYTKTSTMCYSMESACESGKLAAITLCNLNNTSNNIYIHKKKKFMLFNGIRYFDLLIYNKKYHSIYIGLIIILLIVIFIIKYSIS